MAWQIRLFEEKHELDVRLAKLRAFLESAQSSALPPESLDLMYRQLRVMTEYQHILIERLRRLPNQNLESIKQRY
jgi:hypothetical protein